MDGDWFEIGADYARASRDAICRLFPATPTISLPPWSLPTRRTEYDYNCYVEARSPGQYMCLDRNRALRDPLGARSPLEICDLLGPGNELIHVKRAEGSAPLTTWCAISGGSCWPGGLAGVGYRSAARSETRTAMAV
jgi:uncharacterized protein (TIGR04141 family)